MSTAAFTQNHESIFSHYAPGFIDAGYSPIPRVIHNNGEAKPGIKGWSNLCEREPSERELGRWAAIQGADISLATGFDGLLAIDADTSDPKILAAVRRALPHCGIARFGSKGFALLARYADGPCKGFNIYAADESRKSPLVEVLGLGRNITVPPSIHATTRKRYKWIDPATGEPPLYDEMPPLHELPIVTDADLQRLRDALAPFARKPREPRKRAEGGAKPDDKRLLAYAQKGLERATAELAGASEGRPTLLFKAVCGLGWAVHHSFLSEAEFASAFIGACKQNGLVGKIGLRAVEASIDSGLSKSEQDDLPELEDRAYNGAGSSEGSHSSNTKSGGNGARTSGNSGDTRAQGSAPKWGEPEPLFSKIEPEPYPLEALPGIIGTAVREVSKYVKAPLPMIASSALSAISVVSQAFVDVRRDAVLLGPVSLFTLTICDSGERKTQIDKMTTAAINGYDDEQEQAAKPFIKRSEDAFAIWESKKKGIEQRIRKATMAGTSTTADERELYALQQPRRYRFPRLLREDATPEALAKRLQNDWPSAGIVSSEAGIVFGSHGMGSASVMRNLALLNKLWDGGRYRSDRCDDDRSRDVRGARLTMSLMTQESVLREFIGQTKGIARGSGFVARFLTSWPKTTMGTRLYEPPADGMPALESFNAHLASILKEEPPLDEFGRLQPLAMEFSPAARLAWIAYHDKVEIMLAPGHELYDVNDVACKSADNAARIAALLAFWRGAAMIGEDDFQRASTIALWYLGEARRFLGEFSLPAELVAAANLEKWLIENGGSVSRSLTLTRGPYGLRSKETLDAALKELNELNRAREVKAGGKRREIHINPALKEDSHETAH